MRKSQYVQYMCEVLDEELKEYRKAIVRVEKEMKEDPSLSLTFIQEQLHPFLPFLKGLSALVRDVSNMMKVMAPILFMERRQEINIKNSCWNLGMFKLIYLLVDNYRSEIELKV